MNPYEDFVRRLAGLFEEAKGYPLAKAEVPDRSSPSSDAPVVLIFSPHPDDEVIIGGVALRLLRESGWRVVNVAVTQGSNKARQQGRWEELEACCRYVGFELLQTRPGGLEGISLKRRAARPMEWQEGVGRIAEILSQYRPRVILFPHEDDWNSTHIGTHHLLVDAMQSLGGRFGCYVVETEFWGAMDTPNLMVESSVSDVIDMITGLTFHLGEVERNPYHLRLPAWMIDNVRRGGELVGQQGGAPPDFLFATLYRLRRWEEGGWRPVLGQGRFLASGEKVESLFGGG